MKFIHRTPTLTITSDDWFGSTLRPPKRVMEQINAAYPTVNILRHEDYPFDLYNVAAFNEFMVPDKSDLHLLEKECEWMKTALGECVLTGFQAAFNFMLLGRKAITYSQYHSTDDIQEDIDDVCGIDVSEQDVIRGSYCAGFELEMLSADSRIEFNLLNDEMFRHLLRVVKDPGSYIGMSADGSEIPDTIPFRDKAHLLAGAH